MSLKAKIQLTLGFATVLTLVTLFIFFRQEFLTYTLWVVGIAFVLFILILYALSTSQAESDEIEEIRHYPRYRRIIIEIREYFPPWRR